MAEKKKKKNSKLLKKCCCLTLKVGAFIVAVCFLVGIVLSFAYSCYNILLRGRGNAERRLVWRLDGELRKEVYRAAVRAQQSYERLCVESKKNFSDKAIKDSWDKKAKDKDILRFLKMFKPRFQRKQKRSGRFISGYENNFPEEKITENEDPSLPDEAVLHQSFEVKNETQASRVEKVAAQEESEMEYSVTANEKLSEKSPLVVGELGANEEKGAAWSSEIAAVRRLRAYDHNTMEIDCVRNAERGKRIAAQFYYTLLSSLKSDLHRGARTFYENLDICNAVFCILFYILLMVLMFGIIIDNRLMVLIWLATIPFYFIFSMFYMYFRLALMLNIVGSDAGSAVFVILLLILIPLVIFKYFVVLSYYCFMFSPIFWTMYSHNNMQMIVSRRGVDPNQQLKE